MVCSLFPKNVFLLSVALVIGSGGFAQQADKSWVHSVAKRSLQNKVSKDTEALLSIDDPEELRRLRDRAAQEPAAVRFRNETETGISETEETESEIHAAVNPVDTNNLIVAAMKFGTGGLLGAELTFPIYYTKDYGRSWQLSRFDGVNDQFTGLVAGGGDPVIVFDSRGDAYLSWLTLTLNLSLKFEVSLNWAVSRDGGATWTRQPDPIDVGEISDILNPTEGRFVDKEWMAVDRSASPYRDNIYVAYAEINFQDTSYQILVRRKEAGSSGLAPGTVEVTGEDFLFAQFTSIDVDSRGTVHLSFAGATVRDTAFALYHSRSVDGGRTFSAPVKIANFNLPCFPPTGDLNATCPVVGIDANRMYPCPHLAVDRSGGPHDGTLYTVWTADGRIESETKGLDIYFSRSADGGATWSDARPLTGETDPETHQFFPSLSVSPTGRLVVTWYDRRGDPDNRMTYYYLTTSDDGGASFAPSAAVSTEASDFEVIGESNADFGIGEYTQVVTTAGYAMPFWADGRTNDGNIEIYTTLIALEGGVTTGVPAVNTVTDRFSLRGPSPNPAREKAQLGVELKEGTRLSIDVYALNGQLARRIPEAYLPAGSHSFDLDVKGLENGQYQVVVRTEYGFRTVALGVAR